MTLNFPDLILLDFHSLNYEIFRMMYVNPGKLILIKKVYIVREQ